MDTATILDSARRRAEELIRDSGFPLTREERQELRLDDFGLGRILEEGFAFIDLLRTSRLRITLMILLPGQSLPQHLHPGDAENPGKEETLRVIHGSIAIFMPGEPASATVKVPAGKEAYYTARREIALDAGQQYTIPPGREHWLQGGPQGSVILGFQNRVNEARNVFFDPRSMGCRINPCD